MQCKMIYRANFGHSYSNSTNMDIGSMFYRDAIHMNHMELDFTQTNKQTCTAIFNLFKYNYDFELKLWYTIQILTK